ncbi:MAG: hypothetical protein IPQ09_15295 [Myxococcales bacterium]|nr:hypothetical protein [Myxococcales bacterium]
MLATLVARGDLSLAAVALLGAREVGELPLVLWVLASPAARRRKLDDRANLLGKFATTLQFVTVFAVLVGAARASDRSLVHRGGRPRGGHELLGARPQRPAARGAVTKVIAR